MFTSSSRIAKGFGIGFAAIVLAASPAAAVRAPRPIPSGADGGQAVVVDVATPPAGLIGAPTEPNFLDPWVVDLHVSGGLSCRGSLVSSTWVLTAAHCVQTSIYNGEMVVSARRTDRAGTNYDKELARVPANPAHLFAHPAYDLATISNDVALVKLDQAVPFDELVQPVALPTAGRAVGELGKFVNASGVPGQVAIYTGTISTNSGPTFGIVRSDIAACPGDSGSTFVVNRAGVATAVGVVSSATVIDPCAPGPRQEVEFMDVASYVDWITSVMGVPAERAAGNVTLTHTGTDAEGQLYLRCIGSEPSGNTNAGEMAVPGGRVGLDCPDGSQAFAMCAINVNADGSLKVLAMHVRRRTSGVSGSTTAVPVQSDRLAYWTGPADASTLLDVDCTIGKPRFVVPKGIGAMATATAA
jgi:hypothetical protein